MADLLDAEDLAYMRATQAEARPTAAEFLRRVTGRTPTGGTVNTWAAPEPVDVRLDGNPDEVPAEVAARMEGGTAVTITLDLARDVRAGDRVAVSSTEVYEVVSEGDPDRWATAQVVYGRRVVWPPRVP